MSNPPPPTPPPPPLPTLPLYVALSDFVGHSIFFPLPLAVLVLLHVPREGLHLPAVVVVEEIVSNLLLLERRLQRQVGPVLELRERLPFHVPIPPPDVQVHTVCHFLVLWWYFWVRNYSSLLCTPPPLATLT